jgi:hypothetical protein
MSSFNFKRGGTFQSTVTYTPEAGGLANLTGTTITSDILDAAGVVSNLTTSLDVTGLIITITEPATSSALWATGPAKWDIRVKLNTGAVIYSSTVTFTVLPQITLA